jgi:hypothetical protein
MGTSVRLRGAARFYLTGPDWKTYTRHCYQRVAGRASRRDFFQAEDKFVVDLPPSAATLEVVKGIHTTRYQKDHHPAGSGHARRCGPAAYDDEGGRMVGRLDHVHMNMQAICTTRRKTNDDGAGRDLDVVGEVCNKDQRIFDHRYFTETARADDQRTDSLVWRKLRPPFWAHQFH